ncbi:calcium calmodulin-dependent protein kinase [Grosmannia clavigera kw1407]|uniref:Calcium calmodulin-dependent protein kinase n=1 Tax=Grosmannia clavigera (strain kw1407 / UAMH 11150) TaxID=655863 RepID=F0XCS1_GROCL|nr:calcium calmodulin-dependent protein kinase [Grosmannia clavigera kw1407]EFX04635.1 calcium calmodulin-dependent protein kinase [Grosmannia clavigera kw1407]
MSTIQQLKNFIRHGKQARAVNDGQPTPKETSPSRHNHTQRHNPTASDMDSSPKEPQVKNKKVADEGIAQLVADEKESLGKIPKYPGLERWLLLEKMGDGAFSNVYRARDRTGVLSEDVAIKVVRKYEMNVSQGNDRLHPNFKPKLPKAAERSNILKEVAIMRKLDHPNIIRLIEFSEAKQYYYIILELAPGGELFHQIVKLTYFSEELSRHVIVQVAKALEYLHEEQGVVHRDIKPENILFYPIPFVPAKSPKPRQAGDEDKADEGEFIPGQGAGRIGKIKIADFGLSKVVWETKTTTPCGTVGYTAPEIVKDERYSKSVDMWALGCVLYTLLCGFPPFYDESIEALTEKVAKGEFTFLSPWWDDISESAKELISHLLDVDPEKRYTIAEFLNHPWVREPGSTPRKVASEGIFHPLDRIIDGDRRSDFRSPGAVNLREVFDVGYAVHRQEEEDKRRKHVGTRAAGVSRLAELNEELSEEEDQSELPEARGNDGDAAHTAPGIAASNGAQDLEQSMRNTNIRDQEQTRGRERERRSDRGYGQHSATVAAAARQQVRDHNRQKGAFELNLDGATLLGRRGAKPAARVA